MKKFVLFVIALATFVLFVNGFADVPSDEEFELIGPDTLRMGQSAYFYAPTGYNFYVWRVYNGWDIWLYNPDNVIGLGYGNSHVYSVVQQCNEVMGIRADCNYSVSGFDPYIDHASKHVRNPAWDGPSSR